MAHEIVLPRLGWSMDEGVFIRWLKRDGDRVQLGEPLFELEGEKATQEIEAVDAGILRIPVDAPRPGDTVAVGKVLGYLVTEGEAPPESNDAPAAIVTTEPASSGPLDRGDTSSDVRLVTSPQRRIATPRAKRIARELGVDWTTLSGSGAAGRIRECDVRAAARSESPAGGRRLPHTPRRKLIAERMVASHRQTAPVTITARAVADALVRRREAMKSAAGGTAVVPSYQDFIIKLAAEVLQRRPLLAGRWEPDAVVLPPDDGYHVGIAVDTDDGLLVPVIRDVVHRSVESIAEESRRLIERARGGRLAAAEMQGGVFTITNLGAFGIEAFTPVINFPESAILGLGAIRRELAIFADGRIGSQQQLTLSLTFDHRIIDGAPAARFLQELVTAIAREETATEL